MKKQLSNKLNNWLEYIEQKSPKEICTNIYLKSFYSSLGLNDLNTYVITIAGTNGKGSTAGLIERILIENGYTVGSNTSPHLINYNERIKYNGAPVEDINIVQAFKKIEQTYGSDNLLRYSHYAFLAALVIFSELKPDIIILEVGLGGRLDPSNTFNADVAVLTSIGLDHTHLLGDTREKIAQEKVAIARSNKPLIIAEEQVPNSLINYVMQNNVNAKFINQDFFLEESEETLVYNSPNQNLSFKINTLLHKHTISATLAVLEEVSKQFPINFNRSKTIIEQFSAPGRRHILPSHKGKIVLDVSHNLPAVIELFHYVSNLQIRGKLYVMYGSMSNKDIAGIYKHTNSQVDYWHLIDLAQIESRGASLTYLENIFGENSNVYYHSAHIEVFEQLSSQLQTDDCLLVFGSFILIGDLLKQYGKTN
ncbi:Mur ligase family protein [Francisellaceae bacterium]|nr:Mur ligase family protein [Francisellaceae bacterium]